MRILSEAFLTALKSGFLAGLTRLVTSDPDLSLEIRNGYINIYFKGNSLLKLAETGSAGYKTEIHPKFIADLDLPSRLVDEATTARFLRQVPQLKHNIAMYGRRSLEIEYEQMIARANNFEPRNNSDYYVIDRQYAVRAGRFDLIGIFWASDRRRHRAQTVPLSLMEVKFALNRYTSELPEQISRYYEAVRPIAGHLAEESEAIFRQKLDRGLYRQPSDRIEAMKTLSIARDLETFQFIIILVDYNPHSTELNLHTLSELPFANQVRLFSSGFGMWQHNVAPLPGLA